MTVEESMAHNIKAFIEQSNNGKDLGYKPYINYYKGLNLKTSFGQGKPARITWISMRGEGQKTSDGIYVSFLYFKPNHSIVIAYGISEENVPSLTWDLPFGVQKISEEFKAKKLGKPDRYKDSYIYKLYDNKNPDYEQIVKDIDSLIEVYKKLLQSKGLPTEATFRAPDPRGNGEKREYFDESFSAMPPHDFNFTTSLPIQNIGKYIDLYKKVLPSFWKDEKFKWIAVKHFQEHWNLDAENFGAMFTEATSKHTVLLTSGKYFPIGMINEFAKIDSEKVRNMFSVLFDETKELSERITYFSNKAEELRMTKPDNWGNHYQDLRAISVYLMFRYPDKYYIYKYKELKKTIELIGSDFSLLNKDKPEFYGEFLKFMNHLQTTLYADNELRDEIKQLISQDSNCYTDDLLHVAAVDFVFYLGKRLDTTNIEKDNTESITSNSSSRYWIYSPGDQASKWGQCKNGQLMCLGWDEIGDLTQYKSREDLVIALRSAYGMPNSSFMHDSLALWQFVHDMKIGDVIFAKKGTDYLVGRGIVVDDYVYDEDADTYNHVRKVRWTHVGLRKTNLNRQLPQKTLTRIGLDDKKFADDLEALFMEEKKIEQISFSIQSLITTIKSTQLIYDDILIKRFTYSLLTKPFVILSGLAGSGKTQLALTFAKSMVEDENSQLCFVPVGADWTNREPLLGYPNALKDNEYVTPESGVLQLMIEAESNPDKPYFLILDEMNLSYVERYFADFLSAMEAKDTKIKLWDKEDGIIPPSVSLPKNLFIIGTINVDETTYMFSPKVLDRANVIEFKVSSDDMEKFLKAAPDVDIKLCEGKAANMAEDFVNKAKTSVEISKIANDTLKSFFVELKKVNAEFGYRSATEIGRFISLATESMEPEDAIDSAIVQKLLPKLHGSRKKMIDVLVPLFDLCIIRDDDGKKIDESISLSKISEIEECKYRYPLSADKIYRMYKTAIDNGYTSFAEA